MSSEIDMLYLPQNDAKCHSKLSLMFEKSMVIHF